MLKKLSIEVKQDFIKFLFDTHGPVVSRKDVLSSADSFGLKEPQWFLNDESFRCGRGLYDVSVQTNSVKPKVSKVTAPAVNVTSEVVAPATVDMTATVHTLAPVQKLQQKRMHVEVDNAVPAVDPDYVAFGCNGDITTIIKSKLFYPVFISGLSGNGKTTMVDQVCARLKRECYRVNISIETDEDALVGGHTLVDGNVVYREGPALIAMRRGAILLLDEIDRGSNKLICLQAILEGKPYFNKKTGEIIHPAPGFNIFATANTKGSGTDEGKFSAAQILDEAFLERFAVSFDQQYPENRFERTIVMNNMIRLNCVDPEFADLLISWADIIRKTYADGGFDDVISTRRLVHIVQAFAMFGNRVKAIELCVNRFDAETKTAFVELFGKLKEEPNPLAPPDDPNARQTRVSLTAGWKAGPIPSV